MVELDAQAVLLDDGVRFREQGGWANIEQFLVVRRSRGIAVQKRDVQVE